jgi:hypothetical protein
MNKSLKEKYTQTISNIPQNNDVNSNLQHKNIKSEVICDITHLINNILIPSIEIKVINEACQHFQQQD